MNYKQEMITVGALCIWLLCGQMHAAESAARNDYTKTIPPDVLKQYDPNVVSGKRPYIKTITVDNIWELRQGIDSSIDAIRIRGDLSGLTTEHKQTLLNWLKQGGKLIAWGVDDCVKLERLGIVITSDYPRSAELTTHPVNVGCDIKCLNFYATETSDAFLTLFLKAVGPTSMAEPIVENKYNEDSGSPYLVAGRISVGKGGVYFVSINESNPQYWPSGKDKDRWTLSFYQWMLGKPVPGATVSSTGLGEIEASKGQAAVLDIKCRYQFYNIEDSNELSLIAQVIGSFAKDGQVSKNEGSDGSGNYHQYNFVVTGLDKVQELNATLPYRSTKQGDKTVTRQIYEEFDPQYLTNFRTVTIKGSLEVIVSFKTTPGAELFYSLRPDQEISVPKGQIDGDGNVSLKVRIARDQQYIYARTVLGQVKRYLRINIESGQPEEITQEQYLKR